jgi:hypothetical protein
MPSMNIVNLYNKPTLIGTCIRPLPRNFTRFSALIATIPEVGFQSSLFCHSRQLFLLSLSILDYPHFVNNICGLGHEPPPKWPLIQGLDLIFNLHPPPTDNPQIPTPGIAPSTPTTPIQLRLLRREDTRRQKCHTCTLIPFAPFKNLTSTAAARHNPRYSGSRSNDHTRAKSRIPRGDKGRSGGEGRKMVCARAGAKAVHDAVLERDRYLPVWGSERADAVPF